MTPDLLPSLLGSLRSLEFFRGAVAMAVGGAFAVVAPDERTIAYLVVITGAITSAGSVVTGVVRLVLDHRRTERDRAAALHKIHERQNEHHVRLVVVEERIGVRVPEPTTTSEIVQLGERLIASNVAEMKNP